MRAAVGVGREKAAHGGRERRETGETDELTEIKERLTAIESLIQRLPEIQAAAFFKMYDEYQSARLAGKKASDLWVIPPPNLR